MTQAAHRGQPNHLLRQARRALLSPSGSGRPLSRQELADAANAWLYHTSGIVVCRDADYIKRLERGLRHWPQDHYRAALGATTDAELGFHCAHQDPTKAHPRPDKPSPLCATCPFNQTTTRTCS
ncbi:hypothetical protein [Planosporangium mesophilum]|uniref:Uncharacterized protein n=1 Tax=Planosporangium mesophilum TaxID=689768 RepID=A0A8J3TDX7_9ACTN|nr:hypothetical protein [Planosporangium mesophilum]NJC82834.1 hypothetical protein [Planosporangium mesophilum]GII23696.1 hypothetical protein Pme01_32930 [Planosporangium mesophilum]